MSYSFATPWTVACQAPLSLGFPRQEYWSGLPCSPPGDLLDPGELACPTLAGDFLPLSHMGSDASDWPHLNHDQNPGYEGNLENVTFRVRASAMQ